MSTDNVHSFSKMLIIFAVKKNDKRAIPTPYAITVNFFFRFSGRITKKVYWKALACMTEGHIFYFMTEAIEIREVNRRKETIDQNVSE